MRVDREIGLKFRELGRSQDARLAFDNLLTQARARSSLLRVTGDGSQQLLAVEALRNIACMHREFREWPSTWAGGEASVYELIRSLAAHVFGHYAVPGVFAMVWFGDQSARARREREWFIEHARGRRFRAIPGLPIQMTRKMERILLNSPHHLSLHEAIRRAEILALGGQQELVDAILATPLGADLQNAGYWRGAIHWFVNHQRDLDSAMIANIVNMLYAVALRADDLASAQASFSLTGRTPASVRRTVARWKRDGVGAIVDICWPSSGLPGYCHTDSLGEARMFELLDARTLIAEGRAMRNCVGSYWRDCVEGWSSIWSLRYRERDGRYVSRATVEIRDRTIVQVCGPGNLGVYGRDEKIITRWAAHAGLETAVRGWWKA